jgi:PKD repeat protein
MPNLQYNFVNSYDNLSVVTIPLCVLNYTNINTTSCYCGDIDTVVCYPVFNNLPSQLNFIENWGYYIDFGDGTIVNSLTGRHNYQIPGTYNITLIVASSGGNLYKSSYIPTIEAYNLIPDKLTFTYLSGNSAYSSSANVPIQITRTNSFQTYQALSAEGYSIKLSVSGNKSKFQTVSSYETDQYAHLKLFSMFTLSGDLYPINEVTTTCDKIYAQINPNSITQIIYSNSETSGLQGVKTVFVGTSGVTNIYYYEDFKP